jgi:hypothetical protein
VLPDADSQVTTLTDDVPFTYVLVDGSHLSGETLRGHFTKLSLKQAEARFEVPIADFTNLKLHVIGNQGHELPGTLYAKVLQTTSGEIPTTSIRFTSMAPEIEAYFRTLLPHREEASPVFRTLAKMPSEPQPLPECGVEQAAQTPAAAANTPAKTPSAPVPDIAAALSAAASNLSTSAAAEQSNPQEKRRGWLRSRH